MCKRDSQVYAESLEQRGINVATANAWSARSDPENAVAATDQCITRDQQGCCTQDLRRTRNRVVHVLLMRIGRTASAETRLYRVNYAISR